MSVHSFSPNLRRQSGFTLLELLIVIAVIGVLASLAVPRFENQIKKAKFVELVNAAAPYKTAVEMCVQRTNGFSACTSGAEGVPVAIVEPSVSGVVASMEVVGGLITVRGTSVVDDAEYKLTPSLNGTGGLNWAQTGNCVTKNLCEPTGSGSTSAVTIKTPAVSVQTGTGS